MVKVDAVSSANLSPVYQIVIENKNHIQVFLTNFGARIIQFIVPDKEGAFENISLGFDTIDEYMEKDLYFGTTVGRVAGRIGRSRFSIDDKEVQLMPNAGENFLHGGTPGFESRLWDFQVNKENEVTFTYLSPDGENGFPGNLLAKVMYVLDDKDTLHIKYIATTDQPTLYNPTNHIYFALSGDFSQSTDDHVLTIDADFVAEVDDEKIPTGRFLSVEKTPFDFRKGQLLSDAFSESIWKGNTPKEFDDPFLLNSSHSAQLFHPQSGRKISMYTTSSSVVVYTATHAEGLSAQGKPCGECAGITLEAQELPDAIHHDDFGSIILRPEKPFSATTSYHFSLE